MKKIVFIVSLLAVCLTVLAQPRSESQAIAVAREFFSRQGNTQKMNLSVVPAKALQTGIRRISSKTTSTTQSGCYVINDNQNNRFVVVSADERMHEVLGYSDDEAFNLNTVPEGMLFMLSCYEDEYEELVAGNIQTQEAERQIDSQKISPIINTTWDQQKPYNDVCPVDNGKKSYTGCVATAMAQVMNKWKHPETGMGYEEYKSSTRGFRLFMDFSKVTFDWANMKNSYSGNYSTAQKNAVAQLMRACGISVKMDYTSDENNGSGATPERIPYSLIHYFKYNPNLKYYVKKYFTTEEWEEIIIRNLNNGQPILYGGRGKNPNGTTYGHRFVLDGYDGNGKYHFNWGWGGKYNSTYFRLSALSPNDFSFNLEQSMVCDISNQNYGKKEDVFFASEVVVENNIKVGKTNRVSIENLECYCAYTDIEHRSTFNGVIGVGLFDLDFNFIKPLGTNSISEIGMKDRFYPFSLSINLDPSIFTQNSQYYIAVYAKNDDSEEPTIVRTLNGQSDYYLTQVTNGVVKVTPRGIPDPELISSPKPTIGNYNVSSLNRDEQAEEWKVSLSMDGTDTLKYWLTNIDPVAFENGCRNSENKVFGFLNKRGNIRIPTNQQLCSDLLLNNYSSTDSITVYVSTKDSVMRIEDVWGLISLDDSGNRNNLSRHTSTVFKYNTPATNTVEDPVIVIDDKKVMTISCPTIGADIFYTYSQKGETPTQSSNVYHNPISLEENGTVKAIAIKDGISSNITTEEVASFIVEKPIIVVSNNNISIECPTTNTTIFYTTDGTQPSKENGMKYFKPFNCTTTSTIQAIATRENWKDSETVDYYHVVIPKSNYAVEENVAGHLSDNIDGDLLGIENLKITGFLNGSDIGCIRHMLRDGKLAYLDIEGANIVSGGDAYYYTGINKIPVYTEDNVVGYYMFSDNNTLVSLKLPSSIVRFEGIRSCFKLKTLSIPDNCEYVASISGCENFESLYLSKGVSEFYGVSDCPNFSFYFVDVNNPNYKSKDGVLYSKDESILLYYPTNGSKSFTISNKVKTIGKRAFGGTNIENIEIPNSLLTIEEEAFNNSKLNNIIIPESITKINAGTFSFCSSLETVSLPNTITSIGDYLGNGAFRGCTRLSTINIPNNLSIIEQQTFYECTSLKEIIIGSNIDSIAPSAFDRCKSLLAFHVDEDNNKYKSIDGVLFSKNMKTLVRCPEAHFSNNYKIPDGVTKIASNAFESCENLTGIDIPESVVSIGENCFSFCKFKNINLPSSIEMIPAYAFHSCNELLSIKIPSGVKNINKLAFLGCMKLQFLSIPSSVKKIDFWAFADCESLNQIKCDIEDVCEVIVAEDAFHLIPTSCVWQIPHGKSEEYRQCYWWNPKWSVLEEHANGDSNANGGIDVSDVVELIDYTQNNQSDVFLYDVSDLNGDGVVDSQDIPEAVSLALASQTALNLSENSNSEDFIYIVDTNNSNESLGLRNNGQYIAAQIDITVPVDMFIIDISLNTKRCTNHQLKYKQISNNVYRIIAYSPTNEPFPEYSGELFEIHTLGKKGDISFGNFGFVDTDRIFCSLESKAYQTTGIETIIKSREFDIYSTEGNIITNDLNQMPKLSMGIFIVNGRKVVIK